MNQHEKERLIAEIITILREKLSVEIATEIVKQNVNSPTEMLTIKEAAKLIQGLSEHRIRKMCISGELQHFKSGKKYLISKQALFNTVFGESHTQ
jgi:excisionase family DNA binding protein